MCAPKRSSAGSSCPESAPGNRGSPRPRSPDPALRSGRGRWGGGHRSAMAVGVVFVVCCALSIWCARRRRVIPSLGRPQSWTARGRPALSSPTGTVAAAADHVPGHPPGAVVRGAERAEKTVSRQVAQQWWCVGGDGCEGHVGVVEDLVDQRSRAHFATACGEHGSGGHQLPEPGKAARAQLEPVGVR